LVIFFNPSLLSFAHLSSFTSSPLLYLLILLSINSKAPSFFLTYDFP
ncbi:uncharacterized, partial [Tachysurus ichikawai]